MHLKPTPTEHGLRARLGQFNTLAEALDYAAEGETGCNFYTGRGELFAVLPYALLREQAQSLARRFLGLGLERGDRVALVAETHPDFQRFFFACQYLGVVPVPVAPPLHLGGRSAYVADLKRLLAACRANAVVTPAPYEAMVREACADLDLRFLGDPRTFEQLPERQGRLRPLQAGELAYLQYTSGSTRFPRGVMITEQAVLSNLASTIALLKMGPGDRCVSWLPYYHDMGLVGLVLGPVASQLSVDYLGTREFAMRPRQWLIRMTESRATISFSPPFGYELCARRLQEEDAAKFDLRAWRIAGVGAETIRAEPLARFAKALAPSGFDERAFLPCYGLAEASLAVTFAPLLEGLKTEWVDGHHLSEFQEAVPLERCPDQQAARATQFVNCGEPLPGHEVAVRDEQGRELPHRHCGTVFVRGSSIMSGYFGDPEATAKVLSPEGWFDTGDIGYRTDAGIVITGRRKDLIIIKGRNIWPQELENLAEQQPEVRPGDASAFSVPGRDGEELAVIVVQCREADDGRRRSLVDRLDRSIREALGIECIIELVAPHTLVRTSSGKLSRSRTRQDFLERTRRETSFQQRRASV
jgi:fatty-acyl-CoA synthase